jgi:hypothetical protein
MFRGNWSSAMIAASQPLGVASQFAGTPDFSASQLSPKRRAISASSVLSLRYQSLGVSSSNQKRTMSSTTLALI